MLLELSLHVYQKLRRISTPQVPSSSKYVIFPIIFFLRDIICSLAVSLTAFAFSIGGLIGSSYSTHCEYLFFSKEGIDRIMTHFGQMVVDWFIFILFPSSWLHPSVFH